MSVDSVNYEHEIKNLRAEISELRGEVAFIYSAFQEVQEQFGFALAEIANLIKTSNSDTKTEIEKIQADLQQKFDDLRSQNEKIFSRQIEQSDFITDLVNENFNSVQENFSQLEKNLADNAEKFNSRLTFLASNNENTNKILAEIEELLRIVTANQMLNDIEKNLLED